MRKLRGSAWVCSLALLALATAGGAAGCGDDAGDDAKAGEEGGVTKPAADGGAGRSGGSSGSSGSSGSGSSKPGGRDGGRDGSIPQPEPDGGHAGHADAGHADSGAVECVRQSDCPLPASECAAPVCRGGVCETTPLAAGKRVAAQTAGDCLEAVCDGEGAVTMRADDT